MNTNAIKLGMMTLCATIGLTATAAAQRGNDGGTTNPQITAPQGITLNPVVKCDLAIKKIQLNTPTVNQAKITIVNNGPSKSPKTTMLMDYIVSECPPGLSKTQEYNIPELASGKEYVVEINSKCVIGVSAKFQVTVDPHKNVNDPNRSNNSKISDTLVY